MFVVERVAEDREEGALRHLRRRVRHETLLCFNVSISRTCETPRPHPTKPTGRIYPPLKVAIVAAGTYHGHLYYSHGFQRWHQLSAVPMAVPQGDPMAGPIVGREVLLLWRQQ